LKYSLLFKIGLALGSIVSTLLVLEFLLRFYRIGNDERNLLYEHHQELGWFPQKDISRQFTGATTINITHNSHGFRDDEFSVNRNTKNLVIFGDSFAYGYDSEKKDRFSDLLDKKLPNYQVMNLGVSGYSTDQEYLLLQKYFPIIKADLVYLLYCHNDWYGNSVNHVYNGYYKPYFVNDPLNNELKLMGVPVPKSIKHLKFEYPFISKSKTAIWLTNILHNRKVTDLQLDPMITFKLLNEFKRTVEEKLNAKFKIGVVGTGTTPGLIEYLNEQDFSWISIDDNKSKNYFTSSGHWSKKGNHRAAEKIFSHIQNN